MMLYALTPRGRRRATDEEVALHEKQTRELERVTRLSEAFYRERDPHVRRVILAKLCGGLP